jgi:transposase
VGKKPDPQVYAHKLACLKELEALSTQGVIDLYYGDETGVSTAGYCPYAWQHKDEKISIAALPISRQRLNCFGCISRTNQFWHATTAKAIDGQFIFEQLEAFSQTLTKPTVLVLDNARIHKTDKILKHLEQWQQRNLYIFYLPPYSPHLNIAETLWRVMKGQWLEVKDYSSAQTLFEATKKCLKEVGATHTIHFSPFNINYFSRGT